jgi:hypothetical protein
MTNGTVGGDLLEGVDYSRIFRGPSALEAADAIFTNVLELEDVGIVLNAKWAERRPAHCMRH